MKELICDVCKHTLQDPVSNRNYFHICHREICEDCNNDLQEVIKPAIREQDPFSYDWYVHFVHDSVEKAIQKGKF